jgi:hypothetical protein
MSSLDASKFLGNLRAMLRGRSIEKTVGFNTNYAAAVHERLDQQHEQGQAKYLETAMRNNAAKFESFVGGRVAAGMKDPVAAARAAVDVFGEHVIGDAQELAPVDTGALKASGTTLPAEVS